MRTRKYQLILGDMDEVNNDYTSDTCISYISRSMWYIYIWITFFSNISYYQCLIFRKWRILNVCHDGTNSNPDSNTCKPGISGVFASLFIFLIFTGICVYQFRVDNGFFWLNTCVVQFIPTSNRGLDTNCGFVTRWQLQCLVHCHRGYGKRWVEGCSTTAWRLWLFR